MIKRKFDTMEEINNDKFLNSDNLKDAMDKIGFTGCFITYDIEVDTHEHSGIYFISCPDEKSLNTFKNGNIYKNFRDLLFEKDMFLEKTEINPYFRIYKITGNDSLEIYNSICNHAGHLKRVKNTFELYGYEMPKRITIADMSNISDMSEKILKLDKCPSLKEEYKKLLGSLIKQIDKRANKSKVFKSQRVKIKYFENRKIDINYIPISYNFLDYYKKELEKYPQAIYSIDFSNTLSKLFKKECELQLLIPQKQTPIYNKIYANYLLKDIETQSLEDIKKNTSLMQFLKISLDDVFDYEKALKYFSIPFYLDKDYVLGSLEENKIRIAYRIKDENTIQHISEQLENNKTGFFNEILNEQVKSKRNLSTNIER